MRSRTLSPAELARGRRLFSLFNILNTVSFQLLSGNIITLFALRIGAGSLMIGVLSAFSSLSPILVLAGRPLVPRMKATTLMGVFWVVRYLFILPLVFSPPLALTGFRDLSMTLLFVGVLGFNIARGIAVTSFNPILQELSGTKDRGEYLSFVQLMINVTSPLVGVAMALLLGGAAPLLIYSVFFAVGILSGLYASYLVFKLPEPREYATQVSEGLWTATKKAFASRSMALFIASLFVLFFFSSMAGPFFIVYMKEVYKALDSQVIVLTVLGGLGAIAMALASGITIDRLGAKPLFFFFTAAALIGLLPMMVSPPLPSMILMWLFGAGIFFLFTLGTSGGGNAAQAYFFSIVSSRENLNMGILYQLVAGVAGAAGALAGGAMLDGLSLVNGWTSTTVFRVFFGTVGALCVLCLALVSLLKNVGSYSIRDTMGIIFSPRDMRALSLLRRLDRSSSIKEELEVIDALAQSQSEVSIEQLLEKLSSPSFIIRSSALSALRALPLDPRTSRVLIEEVEHRPFTTAYIAAEILGEKGVHDGIEALRRGLYSRDYFLAGKCMVSLARLGDRESIPAIRAIVEKTDNPRLIIHGASALEAFHDAASVEVLLEKLRGKSARYLKEDLILAAAGILGMQEWFYPMFSEHLEDPETGLARLLDEVERREKETRRDLAPLKEMAGNASGGGKEFTAQVVDLLGRLGVRIGGTRVTKILARSAADEKLMSLPRYRFFLACAAVWFYFNGARQT